MTQAGTGTAPQETQAGEDAKDQMGLAEFIERYKDSIAQRVIEYYPPLYQPARDDGPLPDLLRKPLGAQEDAIRAAALSLRTNPGTNIVGEMGTGKTFIGTAAAHAAGFERVLVIMPPHLVEKWKREVEMTVPGASAVIVESVTDLERAKTARGRPLFVIMSRERAKLSYRWKPAVCWKPARAFGRLVRDEDTGDLITTPRCPECNTEIQDDDGVSLKEKNLATRKRKCPRCGGALWTADRAGPKTYPLADYVKNRMRGFFQLLIGDEIHEYKGKGSAQGIAGGVLADACGRTLALTGTLMGGYSSTLFHLLYRFSPAIRAEFENHEESKWVSRYGFRREKVRTKEDPNAIEDGRSSRRRGYKKSPPRERPGLAPAALFHLIGNSIFLRLSDVASNLPSYDEEVIVTSMSEEEDNSGQSQAGGYRELSQRLKEHIARSVRRGSKRMLGAYLQALLSYPDGCVRGETVVDPEDGTQVVHIEPLDEGVIYPKEQALIDLVREEKARGRRVLVYITHTRTRDMTARTRRILEDEGMRTEVLLSETTKKTSRREAWIAGKVDEGLDALICHPRLVQTGLDLVDFPTICWFETDYSVYTTRQASRRSWRIGQDLPVRVVFLAYEETIQTEALALIARKMQSSLAVEGELPDEGLSVFGDAGDDLMMSLAKSIVRGNRNLESLENIFRRARQEEEQGLRYLAEPGWARDGSPEGRPPAGEKDTSEKDAPEDHLPETGADAPQKGTPSEKDAPEDHLPETGADAPEGDASDKDASEKDAPEGKENGNGHPGEASTSWEEYIPERKPARGGRTKPKPSSQSLFEWAMNRQAPEDPG